ncbi:hypothetical protein BDW75DRAFT_231886 [Aspergillus navahoensis]
MKPLILPTLAASPVDFSNSDSDPSSDLRATSCKGTNFLDKTVNPAGENAYFVCPVVDGNKRDNNRSFILPVDNKIELLVQIPIRASRQIKYIWVGNLTGDSEYDFVLDRTNTQQSIEVYTHNRLFLWENSLGPNSENQVNIEPGSTAISIGSWDGVTVYDFDGDGFADIAVRLANRVVFSNREEFSEGTSDAEQWVGIINGQTGALKGSSKLLTDFIDDGPLAARFGVGYLDGTRPHLVAFMKNRQDGGDFNRVIGAWTFDGAEMTEEWIALGDALVGSDGHNTRILDVNGDGTDDVVEIGFVLNGEDGSLLYSMPEPIVHGDRYYIGKLDPEREGLQGYGIQQDNEELLMEYYYDAADGSLLWAHYGSEVSDVGCGLAADIDPTHAGYELYNDGKLEKWDWENPTDSRSLHRILTVGHYGARNQNNYNPAFLGDILGDWREEIVTVNEDHSELIIFTTNQHTDVRLYTLAHNPAYRNSMTLKGYMQSHSIDYFLGHDMETPAKPNIRYVGH